jgi:hypothetical protein
VRSAHVCLALVLVLPFGAASAGEDRPPIKLLADFEGETYGDWTTEGEAFGDGPARRAFYAQRLSGFVGTGLVNTFTEQKDRQTGTLTSPPFRVTARHIHFLIAGGQHPGKTCINLQVDGKTVRTATGENHDALEWETWDVAELKGRQAVIQIVDQVSGPWGHIDIDHIVLTDGPPPADLKRRPLVGHDPAFSTAFRYTDDIGLGPEKGITRRDPGDVLEVGDRYYVWYTKTPHGPSGYNATVWYASSPDGTHWTEQGEALPRGETGAWDERSVFTPNILAAEGRYYLFYTAVAPPFNAKTHTAIGAAISDSPDGPWTRLPNNPLLKTGEHGTWTPGPRPAADEKGAWDSHRVDDACLLVRDGTYWLYYKGRQMGLSPGKTKMGLAIAERPDGPYRKHPENPVLRGGHEVLVWPHGKGVACLVTAAGTPSVWYAADGVHFERKSVVRGVPRAPGAYRPDAFADPDSGRGITWGISHRGGRGQMPWLVRFDCSLTPENGGE